MKFSRFPQIEQFNANYHTQPHPPMPFDALKQQYVKQIQYR